MKTPITTDMNLSETTLLNTNHNSNFFNQSTFTSASNQILTSNGSNYTLDSLESRGVNALHRRAEQLKRWQEAEEDSLNNHANLINKANLIFKKRNDGRKIKFSNSTLFLAACASSDYDEINRLLNSNLVDINVGNVDGLTALHHACIDDNPELVEFLLNKGADVNCVDNEGWSPLHATASCDHIEIARLLLLYGADPTLINVDGELALDLAEDDEMHKLLEDALYEQMKITDFDKLRRQEEEKMREDVLEMIRTGIYDPKTHKRTGATILHVASCKGYLDVLQLLFENKLLKKLIDINVKDNEGWTPLCAAVYWNKPLVVELLLQNGADVNIVTNNNQTLEQLTDYDLILNLIATRREQLKKQESVRKQEENKENGNLNKSNAESETQRKAHAKRQRESRRSTQGISAEDVNKAKDQLLLNSSINSTIINLGGNTSIDRPDSKQVTFSKFEPNKVEIKKLETINETSVNEELNPIQSSCLPPISSLQRTSNSNNCEIVEVKSVLDHHVDSQQRSKHREFTRQYRPIITVDENDEVDQELNATVNLNTDEDTNDKDKLMGEVVLNLRRDSLNILHQRKDPKKSAALNHSKDQMRLERLDDYQLPNNSKLNSTINTNKQLNSGLDQDLNRLEQKLDFTVRRDISQDSLDEQTNGNHNDYIGINSTLNASTIGSYAFVNKNGHEDAITSIKINQTTNDHLNNRNNDFKIDKFYSDKYQDRRDVDNNKYMDSQFEERNEQNLKFNHEQQRTNYLPPIKSSNTSVSNSKQFEVPVLIETPCTPEPPIEEESSSSSATVVDSSNEAQGRNSFENDSENNLAKRKRTRRRIDNQEEIDALFNETMNTINHAKFTQPATSSGGYEPKNYQFNKPISASNLINSQTNKPNGNALKLFKKVDDADTTKLPNSTVNRSRPSSITTTNSTYKPTDYSERSDLHNVNSDNLVEKQSDDYKSIKSANQAFNQPLSSNQTSSRQLSQTKEINNELDYKKMYEDLLAEFEAYKIEVNKKEQDYLREKRKMERRISELEEELVQMENVKEDNVRLKNENGALVRVISKLSK